MFAIFLLRNLLYKQLNKAWNDPEYGLTGDPKKEETGSKDSPYIIKNTESSIYIHDCSFLNTFNDGNGGAISIESSLVQLLIEETTVFACKSNNQCGAVYSSGIESCVFNKCCIIQCYTNKTNQNPCMTILISLSSFSQYSIKILNSAICESYHPVYSVELGSSILDVYGDYNTLNQINLAYNKCFINLINYKAKTLSFVSYSTFKGNIVNESSVISFTSPSCSYQVSSVNILDNCALSSTSTCIGSGGKVTLTGCCILNNKVPTLFSVFYSGSFIIINCTIPSIELVNSRINISNAKPKICFINNLVHLVKEE